jgi:hypothetical protein
MANSPCTRGLNFPKVDSIEQINKGQPSVICQSKSSGSDIAKILAKPSTPVRAQNALKKNPQFRASKTLEGDLRVSVLYFDLKDT